MILKKYLKRGEITYVRFRIENGWSCGICEYYKRPRRSAEPYCKKFENYDDGMCGVLYRYLQGDYNFEPQKLKYEYMPKEKE